MAESTIDCYGVREKYCSLADKPRLINQIRAAEQADGRGALGPARVSAPTAVAPSPYTRRRLGRGEEMGEEEQRWERRSRSCMGEDGKLCMQERLR